MISWGWKKKYQKALEGQLAAIGGTQAALKEASDAHRRSLLHMQEAQNLRAENDLLREALRRLAWKSFLTPGDEQQLREWGIGFEEKKT